MVARLRYLANLVAILLCPLAVFSQTVVCREPGIKGMDRNASRAQNFLPPKTSDMSKVVIYVEKASGGFYVHSNYETPGTPNPTKIFTKDSSDLQQIFLSVLFHGDFTLSEQEAGRKAYREHARLLLDTSVFTEGGYPLVDVGQAQVAVVDGRLGKFLIGPVERLDRGSPPPFLMSRVVGCCLFGIPPHLAEHYQNALAARSLDKGNVRFLSLVKDSGTESAIKNSKSLSAARLGESGVAITSLAQIETAFQRARGSTVVLVSHVEGANFVTRDAARNIVSSISMESVRALASKYNVELIDLGCETAQQLKAEKLGLAVTTKFNTVDAVQALDRALSHSSNYADFFQTLTSENLRVVVDHGFMLQGWPLCADIYAKAKAKPVWVKLARVFVNFRQNGQS
jgi:hypothetical protein